MHIFISARRGWLLAERLHLSPATAAAAASCQAADSFHYRTGVDGANTAAEAFEHKCQFLQHSDAIASYGLSGCRFGHRGARL